MKKIMNLAFNLSKKSDPFPNPRVGAVLIKEEITTNGKVKHVILGAGYHKMAGMPHAEIEAIEDAKAKSGNPHIAKGAVLYTTLEPCSHKNKRTPPCTQAIIDNQIAKIVYAMKDPNSLVGGIEVLKKAGVEVIGPIDQKKGEALNRKYIENIRKKPHVVIKMAMSADGKTATKTGDSKWISSTESRTYVHRMRSKFDAVIVGSGTVKEDDPDLTSHDNGRDPFRVIVDGSLSIPENSKVLKKKDGKTIIATSEKASKNKIKRYSSEYPALILVCGKKEIDFKILIEILRGLGLRKILIEGGSELNAKALDAGIVDQLYLFVAPKLVGGKAAKSVIGGEGIDKIKDSTGLTLKQSKKIGPDLLLIYNIETR